MLPISFYFLFGRSMRTRFLLAVVAAVLVGCTTGVPDDLALTVLLEELPKEEGIAHEGFLPCVAVEDRDADAKLLRALHDARIEAVPASECQWVMDGSGSYHRATKRKATLVNVHGYKRAGTIEFEARHHGKYGSMKTLEVARGPSGWKIVKTLRHMLADAQQFHAGDAHNARA